MKSELIIINSAPNGSSTIPLPKGAYAVKVCGSGKGKYALYTNGKLVSKGFFNWSEAVSSLIEGPYTLHVDNCDSTSFNIYIEIVG